MARICLKAAHDGSLSFPDIVDRLMAAGFESHMVDYRRNTQTFYVPDGDSVMLDMPPSAGCAGYIVSFIGRRVLHLGRTAETHIEHFPS